MGGGASTTWRELGQETTWRELGSSCRIGFGMPWRCCWSNGQWLFKMLGRRNRIGEQNRKGEAAQWHARMCGNSSRSLNVFFRRHICLSHQNQAHAAHRVARAAPGTRQQAPAEDSYHGWRKLTTRGSACNNRSPMGARRVAVPEGHGGRSPLASRRLP